MKKIQLLLPALGMMLFASCTKQADCPDDHPIYGDGHVRFSSTIATQTRATGTTWDQADAIGVYAITAGQALGDANIYEGKANVKHTTAVAGAQGSFVPATAGDAISFPEAGALDFMAYYPYRASLEGFAYPIDVARQSPSKDIDLLYSNNAKNQSKSGANGIVSLNFKHMLSLVVLNISAGTGVSDLTGLSTEIAGLKTDGRMSLVDGAITLGSATATLTPESAVTGTTATIAAIVVPGQDLGTAKFVFTLGGKTYEWTADTQMLVGGKKYTYPLRLENKGGSTPTVVEAKFEGSTISDWEEGFVGNEVVLNPNADDTPTPPATEFAIDQTSIAMNAVAGTATLNLTANVEWTATSDAGWLTVGPASGNSSSVLTLTAEANTGEARTARITINAADQTPLVVTVTQEAAAVAPTPDTQGLFAPWSDFTDWNAFVESLNSYGLSKNGDYVRQNTTDGRNGGAALELKGTPTKNDYVFTTTQSADLTGKSKIVLWVKGTSAKSLSINVYVGPGSAMGTDYKCFNVGSMTDDITLDPADSNSYTGTIDTGGEWKKVTLNISGLTVNGSGSNVLALKVGQKANYDLLIDDITVE